MPQSIVAISIATVTELAPSDGGDPVRHLVGVGLLHVTRTIVDQFTCRLSARCLPAGIGEAVLVDWLTEHLPADAGLLGWQLADDIVPALLGAADEAPPDAARAFVDALALAIGRGAIDLADYRGGTAAPPFDQVCRDAGIVAAPIAPDALLAAWGIGHMAAVAEALGINAVAAWRLAMAATPEDAPSDRFEHMAFCLEQDIDRARSRAAAVKRKNRQLLDAYDADAGAGTARDRREAGRLVQAATDYLARLDAALGKELALTSEARSAADQMLYDAAHAGDAQPQRIAAATIAPIYAHPERFTTIVRDDEMIAAAMAAARRREEVREAAARAPARPDLPPAREEVHATAKREPSRDLATSEATKTDAAKRAAIAAALRGHGR